MQFFLALVTLLLLTVFPLSFQTSDRLVAASSEASLKVATLNMYIGFDLEPLTKIQARGKAAPLQLEKVLHELHGIYESNAPKERIQSMAKALAQARPDVVGVQEGVYLRLGGFVMGDYVDSLIALIREEGGPTYEALWLDTTSYDGTLKWNGLPLTFAFRDRAAVLYRKPLRCRALDEGVIYSAARSPVPVLGREVTLQRGAIGVRCAFPSGKSFQLYDTHLDVAGQAAIQEAQAQEFLSYVRRTSDEDAPIIVTGDFNASDNGGKTRTYEFLTANGLIDSFRVRHPDKTHVPGYTCCQAQLLNNEDSLAIKRIDYIFHDSDRLRVTDAQLFANTPFPRTDGSGLLWSSDHFGVITEFRWE